MQSLPRRHRQQPHPRRGIALYSAVMTSALIVGLLGLASLTRVRVERRRAEALRDMVDAEHLAMAAAEHAIHAVVNDSNWRTTYTEGTEITPKSLGAGTVAWKLVDADGDLADDVNDSVDVHGIGRAGVATQVMRCTLLVNGATMTLDPTSWRREAAP